LFDDLSLFEYADGVGVADGGESVGDDEGGASFQEAVHVAFDCAFGFAVQGAGRFVEDQDRGFRGRCARSRRDCQAALQPRGRHWPIPAVATFACGG
jgi:hypothetical protein